MYGLFLFGLAFFAASPASAQPVQSAPSEAGELGLYHGYHFSNAGMVIDEDRRNVASRIVRSISVHPGEVWQLCSRANYRGTCVTLDRSVTDAEAQGLPRYVRSVRRIPQS